MTLPDYRDLAATFAHLLRERVGQPKMAEIRERNANAPEASWCASQDFCDANMIMDAAFRALGVEIDVEIDAHVDLWNDAWNHARVTLLAGRLPGEASPA